MNDENSREPISLTDLAQMKKEIPQLLRALQSARFQAEKAPDQRKYTYTGRPPELGYRLVLGQDPARVPDEMLEKVSPLGSTTLQRLIADEDCPLRKTKVGGRAFVTEASVRRYERAIEEEGIPDYMQPDPRPSD